MCQLDTRSRQLFLSPGGSGAGTAAVNSVCGLFAKAPRAAAPTALWLAVQGCVEIARNKLGTQ
jgi:hypothetical protein